MRPTNRLPPGAEHFRHSHFKRPPVMENRSLELVPLSDASPAQNAQVPNNSRWNRTPLAAPQTRQLRSRQGRSRPRSERFGSVPRIPFDDRAPEKFPAREARPEQLPATDIPLTDSGLRSSVPEVSHNLISSPSPSPPLLYSEVSSREPLVKKLPPTPNTPFIPAPTPPVHISQSTAPSVHLVVPEFETPSTNTVAPQSAISFNDRSLPHFSLLDHESHSTHSLQGPQRPPRSQRPQRSHRPVAPPRRLQSLAQNTANRKPPTDEPKWDSTTTLTSVGFENPGIVTGHLPQSWRGGQWTRSPQVRSATNPSLPSKLPPREIPSAPFTTYPPRTTVVYTVRQQRLPHAHETVWPESARVATGHLSNSGRQGHRTRSPQVSATKSSPRELPRAPHTTSPPRNSVVHNHRQQQVPPARRTSQFLPNLPPSYFSVSKAPGTPLETPPPARWRETPPPFEMQDRVRPTDHAQPRHTTRSPRMNTQVSCKGTVVLNLIVEKEEKYLKFFYSKSVKFVTKPCRNFFECCKSLLLFH